MAAAMETQAEIGGIADAVLGSGAGKPARWWIAVTLVAGALGAFVAVGAGSAKEYDIAPLRVEFSARAALQGSTQISKRLREVEPGHAEAGTHQSPITMRWTITGASGTLAPADVTMLADPYRTADHIRFSEKGKDAIADFGRRLLLLAISGGSAGGLVVSFGRWRRIVGGALSGALALAVVGVLLHQTYDIGEFRNTTYVLTPAGPSPATGVPDLPTP